MWSYFWAIRCHLPYRITVLVPHASEYSGLCRNPSQKSINLHSQKAGSLSCPRWLVTYWDDFPDGRKFDCFDVCFSRVWFGVLTTRSFSKGDFLLEYSGRLFSLITSRNNVEVRMEGGSCIVYSGTNWEFHVIGPVKQSYQDHSRLEIREWQDCQSHIAECRWKWPQSLWQCQLTLMCSYWHMKL